MCTVVLYVSLCLMIFLCPFLHCKALRTAMYKRYIDSIIIIIIIIVPAESFREQCSKFRWENEMVPFRKLQKTWAVIRGGTFLYYFSL